MNNKIEVIQLLRGIAALLVVFFHFRVFLPNAWVEIDKILLHGTIGVDIFFIISGFVIYISTENSHSRQTQTFLIRRFFRVVIPAWIAMLLMLCIKPPYLHTLLLNVFFIPSENNNPPHYGYSFLIVAWTLTYELIFYSIFAIVIYSKLGKQYRGLFSTFAIIFMVLIFQTLTGKYTLNADASALFSERRIFPMQILSLLANPIFLEFIIGIGLAAIYQRKILDQFGNNRYILLIILSIIAFITILFQYHNGNGLTNSGVLALLIVIIALIIQSLINNAINCSTIKIIILFNIFGELSYSLYLIHPIIRSIMLSDSVKNLINSKLEPVFVIFLVLFFTFLSAHIFYKLIEIPLQKLGKRLSYRFIQNQVSIY